MSYGHRLQEAMNHLADVRGMKVDRRELALAAGCSPQNIGMILNNALKRDQKLSNEKHAKAAAFLRVDPHWLSTGEGEMAPQRQISSVQSELTPTAHDLADLFDMIPVSDKVRRAQAFNSASAAILAVLQSEPSTQTLALGYQKPRA